MREGEERRGSGGEEVNGSNLQGFYKDVNEKGPRFSFQNEGFSERKFDWMKVK